ncbi:hypothetical protein DMC47_37560 [Nostoc sp. 3335mG]|nr:hypothetical protein DMC47_37560 [Nostoc sp. 3335mG]
MAITRTALIIFLCLSGCSDAEHTETKWASRPKVPSPYSAMLIEESDRFALGGSDTYHIRLDAAPRNDDGWFFRENLDTDLAEGPKPELSWPTANDLLVTIHTAQIDGQRRRRFGGDGRPEGSLVIRYVADQPKQ